MKLRFALATTAASLTLILSGCAPVLVGGAMVGIASVAADPRTTAEQVTDTEIELKASAAISEQIGAQANISTSAYAGDVLLVGTAPNEQVREKAADIVSQISGVRAITNRIVVGSPPTFSQITSDTWLASKVRTALIAGRDIPSKAVKVTAENDNIYLQGMVTATQAEDIKRLVRSISGVKEVFTLFDILVPGQTDRIRVPDSAQSGASSAVSQGQNNVSSRAASMDPGPVTPSSSPVITPNSPQARPL
ncbi:BON domain-containing protein [Orrella sp. 11846]|uniref:BON domain-containing protein n=1 Tax=Orrella sp. 11846 TaxID=3409913 RepID=UPI003B5CE9CE